MNLQAVLVGSDPNLTH